MGSIARLVISCLLATSAAYAATPPKPPAHGDGPPNFGAPPERAVDPSERETHVSASTAPLPKGVIARYSRDELADVSCGPGDEILGIFTRKGKSTNPPERELWRYSPVPGPHPANARLAELGFRASVLSRNARWVATPYGDNLRLFDLDTGRVVPDKPMPGYTFDAFSPDGRYSAWHSSGGRETFLYDSATGALTPIPDTAAVRALSPDGKYLVDIHGVVRSTATGKGFPPQGPWDQMRYDWIAFSPDGKRVAIPGRNSSVRVYRAPQGTLVSEIPLKGGMLSAHFSASGGLLVSDGTYMLIGEGADVKAKAALYNPDSGERTASLPQLDNQFLTSCDPEGRRLAARPGHGHDMPLDIVSTRALLTDEPLVYRDADLPKLADAMTRRDPAAAHEASQRLRLGGIDAARVRAALRAVPVLTAPEKETLRALSKTLAGGSSAARDAAEREASKILERLTDAELEHGARPILEAQLQGEPDPEAVRRLERLLAAGNRRAPPELVERRLGALTR